MTLDLRELMAAEGGSLPFAYDMNLAGLEFSGEKPLTDLVHIEGAILNRAGILSLQAKLQTTLSTYCARCLKPLRIKKELAVTQPLVTGLADEENEDYILFEGGQLDLDPILETALVLSMDMRFLCSEECLGLCPNCGSDLNEDPCDCEKEIDPRLLKLKDFLN